MNHFFGAAIFLAIFAQTYADPITLDTAIKNAIGTNAEIVRALSDMKIAGAEFDRESGIYDFKFNASTKYSNDKDKPLSLLDPAGTEDFTYNVALSEMVFTGGTFSLFYGAQKTDYNFYQFNPAFTVIPFLRPGIDPVFETGIYVGFTQPILKGLWGSPYDRAAKAAEFRFKFSKAALKFRVVERVQVLKDRYLYYCSAAQVFDFIESLKIRAEKNLLRAKELSKKDGLDAEAELYNVIADDNNAGVELKAAREKFLNTAGYVPETWDQAEVVTESAIDAPAEVPAVVPVELEETLAEVQPATVLARINFESAKMDRQAVEANMLPEFDVTAGYGLTGISSGIMEAHTEMGTGKYYNVSAGATLNFDVPGRFQNGEKKVYEDTLTKAENDYSLAQKSSRLLVRDVHRKVTAAAQNFELMKKAGQSQEKRLVLEEAAPDAMLVTAQRDWAAAAKTKIYSAYEYAKIITVWEMINGKYDAYFNDNFGDK